MTFRKVPSLRRANSGAAAVEFAMTALYWIALMVLIIDFGRVMYMWSASYEATRVGARFAVVCSVSWTEAKNRMRAVLPVIQDSNIDITYPANVCTNTGGCPPTTVTISGVNFNSIIPLPALNFSLPIAKTSMAPETRRNSTDPVCN